MRLRTFAAGVALPLVAWGASPLVADAGDPHASAASLSNKIQQVQGQIGRKRGTERILTTQISAYTARIDRLQARIVRLRGHESAIQADLGSSQAQLRRIQSDLRSERARLVRLRAKLARDRRLLAGR